MTEGENKIVVLRKNRAKYEKKTLMKVGNVMWKKVSEDK